MNLNAFEEREHKLRDKIMEDVKENKVPFKMV